MFYTKQTITHGIIRLQKNPNALGCDAVRILAKSGQAIFSRVSELREILAPNRRRGPFHGVIRTEYISQGPDPTISLFKAHQGFFTSLKKSGCLFHERSTQRLNAFIIVVER
jgi:hypothetical protein